MGSIHSIPEAGFIAPHIAGAIGHARCNATRNLVTSPTLARKRARIASMKTPYGTPIG
jgi:hypothetical protein